MSVQTDDFSTVEILKYLAEKRNIDLSAIKEEMEKDKKKEYLLSHTGRIWTDAHGKYNTYVGEGRRNRKRLTRSTLSDLNDAIVDYFVSIEKTSSPKLDEVALCCFNEKLAQKEISKQSYDRYNNQYKRCFINNTLAEELRSKPFSEITADDLADFLYTAIPQMKLSQKAYSDLKTILRSIFRYAKRNKLTDISISYVLDDLYISKNALVKSKKSNSDTFFTRSETKALMFYLSQRENDIRALALQLIFLTGLRVGEASTLKKTDISGDFLSVSRTEIHYKDPKTNHNVVEVSDDTKTDAGNRMIYLQDEAKNIIKKLMELSEDSEWLISEKGKRIKSHSLRKKMYATCEAIGINPRSPHKIRKAFATTMLRNGVPEDIIRNQMGHTCIETTRRSYVNPEYEAEDIIKNMKGAVSY